VEYYDCMKDPIKNYFLEKMQNTLVSKEALSILIKTKNEEFKEKELDFDSLKSFDELYPIEEKTIMEDRGKPSLRKNYPAELMDKMEKMERYKHLKVFLVKVLAAIRVSGG